MYENFYRFREKPFQLAPNPDFVLSRAQTPVATADSVILDRCSSWFNLAREVVRTAVPGAWVVCLGKESADAEPVV